jgi:hypothetical protein
MAVINSTDLMYNTFLSCRMRGATPLRYSTPSAGAQLMSLRSVLERVQQTRELDVTVEEAWLAQVFGESGRFVRGGSLHPTDLTELGPQNERLFDLVEVAATDLTKLCGQGAWNAVGNLGYALHNVPQFLRQPGGFGRGSFKFSFRIAAFNWKQLSGDLQRALCGLMKVDVEEATRLSQLDGFAIDNSPEQPRRFSELKVASDWTF